jgi:hypothetical protein
VSRSLSEELSTWAAAIRAYHKPRVDAEIARTHSAVEELRAQLVTLRGRLVDPEDVQRQRAANAAAAVENERLLARVEAAKAVQAGDLRAAVEGSLRTVAALIRAHETAAAREVLAAADRFLGRALDGTAYSSKSYAQLDRELPHEPEVPKFRVALACRAREAAAQLSAHASDSDQLATMIDQRSAALSDKFGHGVSEEVIRGVLALAADPGFAHYCRTRAADSRLEAGWRSAIQVLEPFGNRGGDPGPRPGASPPVSVVRSPVPTVIPDPIAAETASTEVGWDEVQQEHRRLSGMALSADPPTLAPLSAAASALVERVEHLAGPTETAAPVDHNLLAVAERLREHLRIGPLGLEREGPVEPRLAVVLAGFECRSAGPTAMRDFETELGRLTAAACHARERAKTLHSEVSLRRQQLDALQAFAELLDALLTGAAGPTPEPIP